MAKNSEWSPNQKYDHVFVIVRLDKFREGGPRSEEDVTVTKAVRTREAAEAEVLRLNRLNAAKGARYLWRVARLERQAPHPQ